MRYVWQIGLVIIFIVVLFMIIVVLAYSSFNLRAKTEALEVLSTAKVDHKEIIEPSDLANLPACVQRWLQRSGVIGKEKIHSVRLTQTGRMRTEEGKAWMHIDAVQYVNVDEPGFLWQAKVKMAPLISLVGKDRYYQGHGSMLIKLLALVPVVDSKTGTEMDQGALLRYMAEMVWYPTAALNNYIKWEEIDSNTARATMTWKGVSAPMVFKFNDQGDLVNTLASRYQEVKGKYVLNDWGGTTTGYHEFNGIRIGNKTDVIWKYKTGDFNWLQIEVTNIDYNVSKSY